MSRLVWMLLCVGVLFVPVCACADGGRPDGKPKVESVKAPKAPTLVEMEVAYKALMQELTEMQAAHKALVQQLTDLAGAIKYARMLEMETEKAMMEGK